MNAYTKQFHSHPFPGPKDPYIEVESGADFWWQSNIPFVDIDAALDVEGDYQYVHQHHQQLFTEMDSQINRRLNAERENRLWYYNAHGHGWQQCIVVGGSDIESRTIITGTQTPDVIFTPESHPEILEHTLLQLHHHGMSVRRLMIAAVDPGGWVQPHIDPKQADTAAMAHFWIPLNDCVPSLKIWPYGYVPARVGHIYLFNNQNWTHSVFNQNHVCRYVLVGLLDITQTADRFLDLAIKSAREQWQHK